MLLRRRLGFIGSFVAGVVAVALVPFFEEGDGGCGEGGELEG